VEDEPSPGFGVRANVGRRRGPRGAYLDL
jgi:hypothetical protein